MTLPELHAVLADPNGLTWRVVARNEADRENLLVTLRPNGGAWLTVLRSPAMLLGWEVL